MNHPEPCSAKALLFAAVRGDVETTRVGVANCADGTRDADNNGKSALMLALFFEHPEVARLLIPVSDLRQTDHDGWSALMHAVCGEDHGIVQDLIAGGDPMQTNRQGKTALDLAIEWHHWECVDRLVAATPSPAFETLKWPEAASAGVLPRWRARLEQQELSVAVQPEKEKPSRSIRARPNRI